MKGIASTLCKYNGLHCQSFCQTKHFHDNKTLQNMLEVRSLVFNMMTEIEQEGEDFEEVVEKIKKFLRDGCGCTLGPKNGPCSLQFTRETVLFNLNNCLELSSAELDLVILTSILAFTELSPLDVKGVLIAHFITSRNQFARTCFCAFMASATLDFVDLKSITRNTVSPYGNTRRLPENALPQSTTEDVHSFMSNYVEENAIVLPGRIPRFKSDEVKVLQSSESKMGAWHVYNSACQASNKRVVSYSKFLEIWGKFFPNVVISKPMTDLCMTCQQNTNKLQRAANLSEVEKSECIRAHQEHINCAPAEGEFYKNSWTTTKKALEELEADEAINHANRNACSLKTTMHYSFDYAQQVHYPSNPMQLGPIYFKTPRKCGIFGVMCEAILQQVNFVIDEAFLAGKGANATISYVHFYFEHHDLGRQMHTSTLITVPDKIKTIILCGTWLGEFSCTSTIQSFIHFLSLVTPNLAPTVVSGSSTKPTKSPTSRLCMKSRGWLKLQAMLALTKLNLWELTTGEYLFLFITRHPSWNPNSRRSRI